MIEKHALIKRLKTELKNEEMSLVLLKKLKQSQQLPRESGASVGCVTGGATLTPTGKIMLGKQAEQKSLYTKQNSIDDHLTSDKMVRLCTKSVHMHKKRNSKYKCGYWLLILMN